MCAGECEERAEHNHNLAIAILTITGKILLEIVKRWGLNRTQWVADLCFDDLLLWNTWMYERRREAPLGELRVVRHPWVSYE